MVKIVIAIIATIIPSTTPTEKPIMVSKHVSNVMLNCSVMSDSL